MRPLICFCLEQNALLMLPLRERGKSCIVIDIICSTTEEISFLRIKWKMIPIINKINVVKNLKRGFQVIPYLSDIPRSFRFQSRFKRFVCFHSTHKISFCRTWWIIYICRWCHEFIFKFQWQMLGQQKQILEDMMI